MNLKNNPFIISGNSIRSLRGSTQKQNVHHHEVDHCFQLMFNTSFLLSSATSELVAIWPVSGIKVWKQCLWLKGRPLLSTSFQCKFFLLLSSIQKLSVIFLNFTNGENIIFVSMGLRRAKAQGRPSFPICVQCKLFHKRQWLLMHHHFKSLGGVIGRKSHHHAIWRYRIPKNCPLALQIYF